MDNNKETIQLTLENELHESILSEKTELLKNNGIYGAEKTKNALINALNNNLALECIEKTSKNSLDIPNLEQMLLQFCNKEATLITPNNNVHFKIKEQELALVGLTIPMFGEFANLMNWEKNDPEKVLTFKKGAMYSLSLRTGIPFKDFIHISDSLKLCNFEHLVAMNPEQRRNFILDQFLHPDSIPDAEATTFEQIKNSGEEVLLGAWSFTVFFIHNEQNEKAMRNYIHNRTAPTLKEEEKLEAIWNDFIHEKEININHHNFIMKPPQTHNEAIHFLTKMTFRKWEKQISHNIKTNSEKLGIPFVNLEKTDKNDMLEIENFEVTLELNNEKNMLNILTTPRNTIGISSKFIIGLNANILDIVGKENLYQMISSAFVMPEENWNMNSNSWNFHKDDNWFSITNNKKTNIFEENGQVLSFERFKEQIRHN